MPERSAASDIGVESSANVLSDDEACRWLNVDVKSKREWPDPVVIFMVGGPGAGKMTIRKMCVEVVNKDVGADGPFLTEGDFVIAGIDRIVNHVFGGDRECAGYEARKRSDRKWTAEKLFWELRKLALDQHRNLIIDGVGGGHFTLLQENLIYRKPCHSSVNRNGFIFPKPPSGYKKVYVCHANINPRIALERARKRAVDPKAPEEDRGRIVPERSLMEKHEAVEDIVSEWQDLARLNPDVVFLEYDNNGEHPVLVRRIEMVENCECDESK